MKIVDYKTFIQQPVGTLYCETEPEWFGEINVFQGAIGEVDFLYQSLNHAVPGDSTTLSDNYHIMEAGTDIKADYDCTERDGLYEHEKKFLIYSKEDVQDLIKYLQSTL